MSIAFVSVVGRIVVELFEPFGTSDVIVVEDIELVSVLADVVVLEVAGVEVAL